MNFNCKSENGFQSCDWDAAAIKIIRVGALMLDGDNVDQKSERRERPRDH
jgi:hypothetical protein